MDNLFKILFLLGLVAGWLLRIPHFRRLRRQGVPVVTRFRATAYMTPVENLLAILALIGILVIPVVYVFVPWLDFADYRLPTWVGGAGVGLLAAGLWLQWRARVTLGHNLRPTAGSCTCALRVIQMDPFGAGRIV
jgi:hypothetical protein